MLNLLTKTIFRFSSQPIPLSLAFPYQYTLKSADFAFMDIRFTEIPLNRQLWQPQRDHMHQVLKRFENILNGNKDKTQIDKYVWNGLRQRCLELGDISKQCDFRLKFNFNLESVSKSQGYYEIKPLEGLSLQQKNIQYIHNYKFHRQKEILEVEIKEKKEYISPEQQLKKDMLKNMEGKSKEAIQQIKNMTISKQQVLMQKIADKIFSLGQKKHKVTKFEPYYIVEQIKGTLQCELTHGGQVYKDSEIQFDTKWLYKVINLESNDLKKYRKRTLFDFQYWQRGSIFPIKNFAEEVQLNE